MSFSPVASGETPYTLASAALRHARSHYLHTGGINGRPLPTFTAERRAWARAGGDADLSRVAEMHPCDTVRAAARLCIAVGRSGLSSAPADWSYYTAKLAIDAVRAMESA